MEIHSPVWRGVGGLDPVPRWEELNIVQQKPDISCPKCHISRFIQMKSVFFFKKKTTALWQTLNSGTSGGMRLYTGGEGGVYYHFKLFRMFIGHKSGS